MTNGPWSKGHSLTNNSDLFDAHFGLHLAPLHEEQEALSVLRNSSPLFHLLHAFLALGAALQVALDLSLVALFFGGFWVALVVLCHVQPVL